MESEGSASLPSASELGEAVVPQDAEPRCTGRESLDLDLPGLGPKGTGPRLFCGHVPKDVNDEMVRAHFSKWGTVLDVYFPRHKKTLKRRPFCFVTFANKEDAERALAESGLEIGGVAIKNLTMVEDRDKYYTNKHASARQALLQALKQLGPSNGASNGTATSNSAANGSVLPAAAPAPAPPPGMGGMSPEQLSNLAAVLALEGVPTDVVLQTLGLPPALSAALAAPEPALPQLGGLDGTTALLAQALAASPALSSQTAFDLAARGSFDLRTSFDLGAAAAPGVAGLGSARGSLDLAALHSGLAAAAGLPNGSHMHGVDSRSTLTSVGEWSAAPSARTSLDPGTLAGLPAVSAGFLASATPLSSSLSARLSLDAALQLQQSQQQQAALLAAQAAGGAPPRHSMGGLPPLPPGGPQHNMASVMHSGFYQAGPAAPPPPPPQVQAQEVQERLAAVMSSGFYSGAAAPPPAHPPHVRHSMCEFGSASGGGLVPFGDAWAPQPQPQHAQQAQQGTLGGYSTVLRPSIDRAGLPPLPPRSPNQDRQSGSPPDTLMGLSGGWPLSGQRVMA